MADDPTPEANDAAPAKKKLPLKTLIVILVVMIVEGALFGGLYMVFGNSPGKAQAQEAVDDTLAAEEEEVEIMLIADKFQNRRQGSQSFLYDTTIFVLVKRKNLGTDEQIEAGEGFEATVEGNLGRVRAELVSIFARAEPSHLNEPELNTLRRQILDAMRKRFGNDPDGEPYILDVVISDWKRYDSDM
ncbi:MAG: hypothetical protein ACIAXF_15865 [Phycisphaerales bacterium JB063]